MDASGFCLDLFFLYCVKRIIALNPKQKANGKFKNYFCLFKMVYFWKLWNIYNLVLNLKNTSSFLICMSSKDILQSCLNLKRQAKCWEHEFIMLYMSQTPHHLVNLKKIRNLFDFKEAAYYFMGKHLSRQSHNNFQEVPNIPMICLEKSQSGSSILGTRNRCELQAQ